MAKTATNPTNKPRTKRKIAATKQQFERFVSTARELGVEESKDTLDRAFDRVVRPKSPRSS
ncbi:MAG TPA: hypothetical protein VH558_07625 [Pseudolabrys sp.]|jgi:hypothetical protein